MGIASDTGKMLKFNNSLLRKKSFFREIAAPRAIRKASRIDGTRLERKAIILAKRKLKHRLTFAVTLSLILFAFSLLYSFL